MPLLFDTPGVYWGGMKYKEEGMERINAWTTYKKREEKKVMDLGKAYRAYLDSGKTERECARETIRRAEKAGYVDLEKVEALKAGDRVYVNTMNKAVQLYIIGSEPLEKGLNIVGAHIDSPRMDLKQNPLYEDTDLAYLDTHYYGGIKKYQWVTLPLALHGVLAKKDGTVVDVVIGEDEEDPVVGRTRWWVSPICSSIFPPPRWIRRPAWSSRAKPWT